MTTQIAVRLPDDLVVSMDLLVPGAHASRSQVVRRAIEVYLAAIANDRDAAIYERTPLRESELVLTDDPDSWAGTPAW
ncbi:MAG: ribbon-helix-helix domain-containing protein [Sporichthyaceae bacterium]